MTFNPSPNHNGYSPEYSLQNELTPDAWERFESLIRLAGQNGPTAA